MAIHKLGTLVLANQAVANIMGASNPEALFGVNVIDFVHPSSREAVIERITMLSEGKAESTAPLEEQLVRLDGKVIQVEILSLLIEYEDSPAIQLVIQDVTERKAINESLQKAKDEAESERRRLHSLFTAAPAMIAIVSGPDHIYELANPMYLAVTNKSSDIIGKSVAEVFPEIQNQGILNILDDILISGQPFHGTETLIKLATGANGALEDHYFNLVYLPSIGADGKTDSILVHAVDITQTVLSRQEIEDREKQYRSIFDASHDGILIFNQEGRLVEANPSAVAMHEYSYNDLLALSGLDLIYPGYEHVFSDIAETVTAGDTFRGSGRHRKSDGEPIEVEIIATGVIFKSAPHLLVVVRDITERVRAETEINYQNNLLKTVTDNATFGLFIMDAQHRCTFMNSAAEKMTGYSHEQILALDRPLHDIIHHSHPDGSPYPLDECPIDRALPQQKRESGQDIFIRGDGSYYPVRFTASPLVRGGEPIATIIELEDLTESIKAREAFREATERGKELEAITVALNKQQEELLALNRSKDEFISLASHQLRTPATGVKLYVGMALEGMGGTVTSKMRPLLQTAYESNDRQLQIIDDLLKVATIDAGKVKLNFAAVDLVGLVRDILSESASWFEQRQQQVVFTHKQKKVVVTADHDRLRMALENIIDNASKYTVKGKKIYINVTALKRTGKVSIRDEGVGISQEDIDKIFQKFARIDNPLSVAVGGSGLGLYWTQKIINLHRGDIAVTSKIGEGSNFVISLPAASI